MRKINIDGQINSNKYENATYRVLVHPDLDTNNNIKLLICMNDHVNGYISTDFSLTKDKALELAEAILAVAR